MAGAAGGGGIGKKAVCLQTGIIRQNRLQTAERVVGVGQSTQGLTGEQQWIKTLPGSVTLIIPRQIIECHHGCIHSFTKWIQEKKKVVDA